MSEKNELRTTCGKCYKLDRRALRCDKHGQPAIKKGKFDHEKCESCLEETKNGKFKF